MRLNQFKEQLQKQVRDICTDLNWKYDDNRLRGMAFENWCFELFAERFPNADNSSEQNILRTDDFNVDICFPCKEEQEVYYIQCKFEMT